MRNQYHRTTLRGAVMFTAMSLLLLGCGEDEEPRDPAESSTTITDASTTTVTEDPDPSTTVTTEEVSPPETDAAVEPEETETAESSTTITETPVTETTTIPEPTPEAEPVAVTVPALPLAPDCSAWSSQGESQEWMDLNGQNHDTSNIDTNGDGLPCTLHFAPPPTAGSSPGSGAPVYGPSSGACWDCLAQCESGGNWSINTGNGFSGGLQFHHGTWVAYGGQAYASEAWMASREAQIAVAEKVLADVGRGAWPGCTAAGLW